MTNTPNTAAEFDLSKRFAWRLLIMIESRLLNYAYSIPWADAVISALDSPPTWVLDLSTTRYSPDAAKIVREYVYSEPFEEFGDPSDLYVGCLYLRYERRAISWATFLEEAGMKTDPCPGRRECEYFFGYLTDLEEADYSVSVEEQQRKEVQQESMDVISSMRQSLRYFLPFRNKDA